jgi:hypothetical protein
MFICIFSLVVNYFKLVNLLALLFVILALISLNFYYVVHFVYTNQDDHFKRFACLRNALSLSIKIIFKVTVDIWY